MGERDTSPDVNNNSPNLLFLLLIYIYIMYILLLLLYLHVVILHNFKRKEKVIPFDLYLPLFLPPLFI